MKLDEIIQHLQNIKNEYGNLEVIGADEYEIDFIRVKRYIEMKNDHNSIIRKETEDLDEEGYLNNWKESEYSKNIISEGLCVKIY